MRHACWVMAALLGMAAVAAAEDVGVVLDDFTYPAWGGRWVTLQISKFTPPQLVAGEKGPDGTPSAQVNLPSGGRIVLNTAQETEQFDGIYGKLPWPLPEASKKLTLAIQVKGEQPVNVVFVVRDRSKRQTRTAAQIVQPGGWTTISADLPAAVTAPPPPAPAPVAGAARGNRPARNAAQPNPPAFVGIELTRSGAEANDPQPVLIDDLRVTVDNSAKTVVVTAGRANYDASPVVGKPIEFFARLQATDASAAGDSLFGASIQYQGAAAVKKTWGWSAADNSWKAAEPDMPGQLIAVSTAKAVVKSMSFTPTEAGTYTVTFRHTARPDASALLMTTLTIPVYPDKFAGGLNVESAQVNQKRVDDAVKAPVGAIFTNLSPAMAIRSSAKQFKLFDGISAGQALDMPGYVAIPQRGGVKVHSTSEAITLDNMTQPWMIFFAGDTKGWDKIQLVSRGKKIDAPIDLPWLVVLQRKPATLRRGETGMMLDFPKEAGYVTIMPLHGMRTYTPGETTKWIKEGLPEAEAKHAYEWARRLFRIPVNVTEDFKVDVQRDVVTVRQMFQTVDLRGDWNIEGDPFAPIPPMLTMAWQNKFPVKFYSMEGVELKPADGEIVSGVGPIFGIAGHDNYTYEISGMLKYINEDRQPVVQGAGEWGDRLRQLIRTQTPPADGSMLYGEPDASNSRWEAGSGVREDYGIAMVGNSERQGLLGSTIPYVDNDEAAWRKNTLLIDALYMANPNNSHPIVDERTGRIHSMEGRAWAQFHNWVDDNAYCGDILRAMDYYVRYTGDLETARKHWGYLRSIFAVVFDFKRHGEWELCNFNTGGGDSWDSVYGGVVGFARLADRLGDADSYRYASYYFAKHAATLAGQRQVNKLVASMPYWASTNSDVSFTPDKLIANYTNIDVLKWVRPAAGIEDLVYSDVWGQNYGLRAWNQTVFMRGSRSEYRLAADIVPDYAKYWLDARVKKFATEWYQSVLVSHKAPPENAMDERTGQKVVHSEGDYVGHVALGPRAIILGESIDSLWAIYQLKAQGVRVLGSDGRVPRLSTLVQMLEDGTNQPWVRLYGQAAEETSRNWERGWDAYLDLGNEDSYMYGLEAKPAGFRPYWGIFVAPNAQKNVQFGYFGPAGESLKDVKGNGATWNTTIYSAGLSGAAAAPAPEIRVQPSRIVGTDDKERKFAE